MLNLSTAKPGQRALAFAGALVISLSTVAVTAGPARAATSESGHRLSYVLMTGDGDSMMSASSADYDGARALRAGGAPLLYVRQNGAAYVIRDPAILRRAEQIMQPQQEMGRRQAELGRQQAGLGGQQGAIGAQQGRLGAMMAASTPAQMRALGDQQRDLGRRQEALGVQQAALGQRQAALGREQARLAALAEPQFRALLDEAIRRGLARRV
jgi:bla regulator protein BlaR1